MNVVAAALAAHLVKSWAVTLYYMMGTVWAVPTLLVMLIGTMLDRRCEAGVSGTGPVKPRSP